MFVSRLSDVCVDCHPLVLVCSRSLCQQLTNERPLLSCSDQSEASSPSSCQLVRTVEAGPERLLAPTIRLQWPLGEQLSQTQQSAELSAVRSGGVMTIGVKVTDDL